MSYRGRGCGGFSGGGGFGFAKQEPFVLFPDIDLRIPKGISDLEKKTHSYRGRKLNQSNSQVSKYLERLSLLS